jgi:site-specific recombinase
MSPYDATPLADAISGLPPASRDDWQTSLSFLSGVFASLRPAPSSGNDPRTALEALVDRMDDDPTFAEDVFRAVTTLLRKADLVPMLTESGMAPSRSLGKELFGRIRHKCLPPLREDHDFRNVFDALFPRPDDHRWVAAIGRETWGRFFSRIRTGEGVTRRSAASQVMQALGVLSVRLAHLGCEPEVARFLPGRPTALESPFSTQQQRLSAFLGTLRSGQGDEVTTAAEAFGMDLNRCSDAVASIRASVPERGAGLGQTFLLYQAEQLIGRMRLLLDTVDGDGRVDTHVMAEHFMQVVRYENTRFSLREFLSQATGQLAYQIAEHKGRKGDSYITSSRNEYLAMLLSAMKGGLVISFVAILKNLLGRMALAPFWQGLAYSLNYGVGFVVIDRTGAVLATKQPAYTANAVAGSIDRRRAAPADPSGVLVENLVKLSRSQFASFAGNLMVVFPGTWLLATAWDRLAGSPLASGDKARTLLADQHPFDSMALVYACNTGVCLFLSGLIAGYVQNRMRYGRIPERLARHTGLARMIGEKARLRLSGIADEHAGALAGSLSLGFMLGMAGMLGRFFGIPFDIRHITISAGNLSIGLYGLGWGAVPGGYLLTVLFGVLCIGFLNFLVSFSLAFYVAMRSRGLHLQDTPRLLRRLGRELLRRPLDFIRPPRMAA